MRDRWSLDWEDALADKGYIVVCADGRGTGFRGEKFKKQTYGRLGALEVEDQLSLARYMAAQPYTDPARIGIYGWSYGGFMALSCALKGHGLFKMAIAVGARSLRGATTTRSTPKSTTTCRSTTLRVTTTTRRSTSPGCSTTPRPAC